MAAILFSKISQKICKRKHFKLIVHWKLLKPILSEIETECTGMVSIVAYDGKLDRSGQHNPPIAHLGVVSYPLAHN